jgi:hypothetical protein
MKTAGGVPVHIKFSSFNEAQIKLCLIFDFSLLLDMKNVTEIWQKISTPEQPQEFSTKKFPSELLPQNFI